MLSSLIMTEAVAVAPAASITVPVTGMLDPCAVMTLGEGHVVIGAPPGVQVKLTVTGLLFHPAAFGAGVTIGRMVGAVLEMFNVI